MSNSYSRGYEDGFKKATEFPDAINIHVPPYWEEEYRRGIKDGFHWGVRCRIAEQHKAQLAQNIIKEKP